MIQLWSGYTTLMPPIDNSHPLHLRIHSIGGRCPNPRGTWPRNCTSPHYFIVLNRCPFLVPFHSVNHFLPHASKFGFFLDTHRFLTAFFTPTAARPRPSSVLRSTVYLWGIHLSQDAQVAVHEQQFLSRALRSIHIALSNSQPQDTLHVLQAEVLLAYYFFHNDRLMEGKFHASAAVSLAIMCDLHKVSVAQRRGSSSGPSSLDLLSLGHLGFSLPPPKDVKEEGERIHAWWTTYILDKAWVVALASPSAIKDDDNNVTTRIDTPWPLDFDSYDQVRSNTCSFIQLLTADMPTGSENRRRSHYSNLP